jgi:DNA topoisomerase-3
VFHTVAKVALPEETIRELLATGKTKAKVTGFTSKAGNLFDTCLKYEDDQIKFDFDNPGQVPEQENRGGNDSGNSENQHTV